jgi:hypothetical protein
MRRALSLCPLFPLYRFSHHHIRPGVRASGGTMTADKIMQALQDVQGSAAVAGAAAKAGFLEWVMTLPNGANACTEAKQALCYIDVLPLDAEAAHLFVGYLRAASQGLPAPTRRGGSMWRRRTLH